MALRNLLLNLDETRTCEVREDAALAFAAEHGAHITALYCIGEIDVQGWVDWTGTALEQRRQIDTERAEEVVARFRDKADRAGVAHETRTVRIGTHLIASELAMHARYADLLILGQVNPDEPPAAGRHMVEQVVLDCGCPVLVIPWIGAPKQHGEIRFGRRITVAWDAGREAARAVHDGLPLLERSEHVDVIAVNPLTATRGHGPEPGSDIALYLSRHGIEVEVQQLEARDLEPADTILARLSDHDSDMLLMGAYGHSRMRELVLGGVTRGILEHMTVPVLMSH